MPTVVKNSEPSLVQHYDGWHQTSAQDDPVKRCKPTHQLRQDEDLEMFLCTCQTLPRLRPGAFYDAHDAQQVVACPCELASTDDSPLHHRKPTPRSGLNFRGNTRLISSSQLHKRDETSHHLASQLEHRAKRTMNATQTWYLTFTMQHRFVHASAPRRARACLIWIVGPVGSSNQPVQPLWSVARLRSHIASPYKQKLGHHGA